MARAVLREIVFGLATTGLLLGCVDTGGKSEAGDSASQAAAPAKKKGTGKDIEAPEIFQTTDSALWDGRPSLGGIWVASPDVTDPQRVVMFNPATGKTINGALFRRERENPGPKLQLSSDAAEALGILAGAPTEIRVTALKKDEIVEEPAAAEAAAAPADPAKDGEQKPKEGDAAAIASAALDVVDAGKPADSKPADGKQAAEADPVAAAAAGTAALAATAADGTAAVVDATPKKKTWKERRAEAKAAREAKKKAAAEAKAAAAAAAAGTAVAAGTETPAVAPDAAAAAVAPIESAPLDARSPEATAPVEKKKSKRKVVGDTAAPAVAAADPDPAPAAPAATGPARPIQVASFSKEDNAKRAADALAKIGVSATPQKSEKGGKAVWGVVVMGDEALLQKIKDAGFADAYFLK